MNNTETLTKMKDLKLQGMHQMYEELRNSRHADSLTHEEYITHLVDAEWDDKFNKKIARLIKNASFRYKANLEEINYSKSRKINKNTIISLGRCDWIEKKENVLITGSTGTGKSFLACALGQKACLLKYKVKYANCMKLFSHLKLAKVDGTYFKEMKQLEKSDLLILDDFGLKSFDTDSRLFLLEILEDRYREKSTIISSQIPVDLWFDIIGDKTIADAICDRFIHNAEKIKLSGPTLRNKKNNSGRKLPLEK